MIRKGYRYLLTAAAAASAAALLTFAARNDFGLGRNMEIMVNMMRELSLSYVDPVDPDKLMEGAAEGMVRDLDPYTEFIPEEQMSDFELLTTGKYGGVGSLIRQKGDWVKIAQPYKGSPADRAGLKIGDKILAIDGKDAKGFTTEQVSSRLKGEPGSKVKVTVEHLDGSTETVMLAQEYVLPAATADQLGGVKVGDYLDIAPDGTLSGKTLYDTIAASVAVKSEARLVWNTHVTSPNKFTTWDVRIPGNVDKICITKGKYNSYNNNTEKSIARGGTTTYDCDYNFTITFQTNGILHVVYPYKTVFPLELWIDGYHYPTLADLLTQVTAVESSVTDLQVALCELYEEKEEN